MTSLVINIFLYGGGKAKIKGGQDARGFEVWSFVA
jgi:hypothetical protein